MAKQRTKNKQELSPKSGAKKKPPEKKTIIRFIFEDLQGVKYTNGTGRMKIDTYGCINFFKLVDNKYWSSIKGKLISLKITQVARVKKINT